MEFEHIFLTLEEVAGVERPTLAIPQKDAGTGDGSWHVVCEPIAPGEAVSFSIVRVSSEFVRIPVFSYLTSHEPEFLVAVASQFCLHVAADLSERTGGKRPRRVVVCLGPVEQVADQSRIWLGLGLLV